MRIEKKTKGKNSLLLWTDASTVSGPQWRLEIRCISPFAQSSSLHLEDLPRLHALGCGRGKLCKHSGLLESGSCIRNIVELLACLISPSPSCFVVWIFEIQRKQIKITPVCLLKKRESNPAATCWEHFRACFIFRMNGMPSYVRRNVPGLFPTQAHRAHFRNSWVPFRLFNAQSVKLP